MTTTNQRTHRSRRAPRAVSAVLAAVVATLIGLVGTAAPASAATGNYDIVINTTKVDFATFIDPIIKEPTGLGGKLYWIASPTYYTLRLVGLMSMKNASGYCGRIKLEALDGNDDPIATEYVTHCPSTNSWELTSVDLVLDPVRRSDFFRAKVSAWLAGLSFVEQAAVYVYD
jgi:hypothetical protein